VKWEELRRTGELTLILWLFRFGILAAEALHATGSIDQFLLAGKERMTVGADLHMDVTLVRRTGRKAIAARAENAHFMICGMNRCLHELMP